MMKIHQTCNVIKDLDLIQFKLRETETMHK